MKKECESSSSEEAYGQSGMWPFNACGMCASESSVTPRSIGLKHLFQMPLV
jgi:hypothetical protein